MSIRQREETERTLDALIHRPKRFYGSCGMIHIVPKLSDESGSKLEQRMGETC